MLSIFRNLSIVKKIAVPAALVAVVAVAIVLSASIVLRQMAGTESALIEGNATRVQLALQAESSFNSAAVSEKNVLLAPMGGEAATNIDLYNKASAAALDAIDHLSAITADPEQRAGIDTFRTAVEARREASAHVFALAQAGKAEEALAYSRDVAAKHRRTASAAVAKLIAINVTDMQDARVRSVAAAKTTRFWLIACAAAGLICAFGILAAIAYREISRPIALMADAMRKLASGDLDVAIDGTGRRDEIGELARSFGVFRENAVTARRLEAQQRAEQTVREERQRVVETSINAFDGQVREALDTLSAASTELHATAESMSSVAEATSNQAMAVAATSDEASGKVQTVATATEQLHASISEISRQVAQSADIAHAAVAQADRTNATMRGLDAAARKIGEVVTLIQSIASRTNLLALNATIEAARAGEAGRGFAVVASEVKALANQTAQATEDISTQIAAIQGETGHAVAAIESIVGTIGRMSEIAAMIAAAVEEQGAATQDIALNIQIVARGTTEVSVNVTSVNEAAEQTGAAADGVLSAADQLSRQADKLRGDVNGFFEKIRAA
jgi:methyl-accepting chemotaxis protein